MSVSWVITSNSKPTKSIGIVYFRAKFWRAPQSLQRIFKFVYWRWKWCSLDTHSGNLSWNTASIFHTCEEGLCEVKARYPEHVRCSFIYPFLKECQPVENISNVILKHWSGVASFPRQKELFERLNAPTKHEDILRIFVSFTCLHILLLVLGCCGLIRQRIR